MGVAHRSRLLATRRGLFAALSRVFPPHPASGIISAAASANPIISFLLFILPSLFGRLR
jgi:hypothetical protein